MPQTAQRMTGRRILAHVAVAAYVIVQLALPIPALVAGFHRTEGYFSWNMFAHRYSCAWSYTLIRPDGSQTAIDLKDTVNDSSTLYRVFHTDVLPRYHRWLCDSVVAAGGGGKLAGRMSCAIVPGDPVELVRTDVDVCRARNGAVREVP